MATGRKRALEALIGDAMSTLDVKQLYLECGACKHADRNFVCLKCEGSKFVAAGLSVGQVIRMVLRIETLGRGGQ
jgi:hypothetical protein